MVCYLANESVICMRSNIILQHKALKKEIQMKNLQYSVNISLCYGNYVTIIKYQCLMLVLCSELIWHSKGEAKL